MSHLSLVPQKPKPRLSLLSTEFQERLAAFNDFTREIRAAGASIHALDFLEKRIVVSGDDVDMISRRYGHEIRSQSSKSRDNWTRHSLRIRDIYVSWFTVIKVQDK